jgi:hypothetical protein
MPSYGCHNVYRSSCSPQCELLVEAAAAECETDRVNVWMLGMQGRASHLLPEGCAVPGARLLQLPLPYLLLQQSPELPDCSS